MKNFNRKMLFYSILKIFIVFHYIYCTKKKYQGPKELRSFKELKHYKTKVRVSLRARKPKIDPSFCYDSKYSSTNSEVSECASNQKEKKINEKKHQDIRAGKSRMVKSSSLLPKEKGRKTRSSPLCNSSNSSESSSIKEKGRLTRSKCLYGSSNSSEASSPKERGRRTRSKPLCSSSNSTETSSIKDKGRLTRSRHLWRPPGSTEPFYSQDNGKQVDTKGFDFSYSFTEQQIFKINRYQEEQAKINHKCSSSEQKEANQSKEENLSTSSLQKNEFLRTVGLCPKNDLEALVSKNKKSKARAVESSILRKAPEPSIRKTRGKGGRPRKNIGELSCISKTQKKQKSTISSAKMRSTLIGAKMSKNPFARATTRSKMWLRSSAKTSLARKKAIIRPAYLKNRAFDPQKQKTLKESPGSIMNSPLADKTAAKSRQNVSECLGKKKCPSIDPPKKKAIVGLIISENEDEVSHTSDGIASSSLWSDSRPLLSEASGQEGRTVFGSCLNIPDIQKTGTEKSGLSCTTETKTASMWKKRSESWKGDTSQSRNCDIITHIHIHNLIGIYSIYRELKVFEERCRTRCGDLKFEAFIEEVNIETARFFEEYTRFFKQSRFHTKGGKVEGKMLFNPTYSRIDKVEKFNRDKILDFEFVDEENTDDMALDPKKLQDLIFRKNFFYSAKLKSLGVFEADTNMCLDSSDCAFLEAHIDSLDRCYHYIQKSNVFYAFPNLLSLIRRETAKFFTTHSDMKS